ncbi:MAG: hypothetical protein INF72_02180 [Roseomonas sp.]|nr:hypothetical protein [Roseomonas sp.]MCA3335235.1 hypothetical protein [Roseomonas sp.]MCA3373275.1 hypothetical protein [Roseomonas sp.]MCA3384186.1 hypothetical protein [Roseomonas sp.]MCA3398227.1 hypothetical protein [Roseomonas sp.]
MAQEWGGGGAASSAFGYSPGLWLALDTCGLGGTAGESRSPGWGVVRATA